MEIFDIGSESELIRLALEALPASVAVIDGKGRIVAVNHSWTRYAAANSGDMDKVGVGANYIEVCRQAAASDVTAQRALDGIVAVLKGNAARFTLDYPCHSPLKKRWFRLVACMLPYADPAALITHTDITQQKLAEAALADSDRRERALLASEQRQRLAVRAAGLGVFEWLIHEDVSVWENQRMYEIFGHTRADGTITRKQFIESYLHPDDVENFEAALFQGWAKNLSVHKVCRVRRKSDEQMRWLDISGRFEFGADGVPDRLVGVVADITERVLAEQELKASEEQLRQMQARQSFLIQLGDLISALQDPEAISSGGCELLGRHLGANRVSYTEVDVVSGIASVVGDWPTEAIHPERYVLSDSPVTTRLLRGETTFGGQACGQGLTTEGDLLLPVRSRPDGSHIYHPIMEDNKLVAFLTVSFDTLERWHPEDVELVKDAAKRIFSAVARTRAEVAMRDSEEGLRFVTERAQLGYWHWDLVSGEIEWSDRCKEVFGIPIGEKVTYERFLAAVHPDDRDRVHDAVQDYLNDSKSRDYDIEFRTVWPDGAIRWVQSKGSATRKDGKPVRMAGVAMLIDDRKQAEEALRDSEERFRSLVELSSDWYWEQDADFRFTKMSNTFEVLANGSVPATLGKTRWEMPAIGMTEEQWAEHRAVLERHEPFRDFEYKRWNERGEAIWMAISGEPVLDKSGQFVGYRGTGKNITQRKRQEEQIRLLMNEVNHRAKNLLAVVQAIATMTARDADPRSFAEELSARLKGLATSQDLIIRNNWSTVQLADLVRSQLRHLDGHANGQIEAGGEPILLVPSAAQAIGMALHELATNAMKYGALSVKTGRVELSWGRFTVEGKERIVVEWIERDGPKVKPPTRRGFGRTVTEEMAAYMLDAHVTLTYSEAGVRWRLDAPAHEISGTS